MILRGTATIEKTQFLNNRAPNGAAVWFSSGELTLRRATFEGNIATGVGGALGISDAAEPAKVSIRYSHFRQNQAASGGAIAFLRAPASERTLRGYGVNFANNVASQNGGAIDAPSGAIDFSRVQMVENQAGASGGAVYGGGDFNLTRLANALAVRNTAATGGVYSGLKLELINATLADNAGGPAIALLPDTHATAKFTNTIFSHNTGGSCVSLPGGEVATFTDGGHNVQFPVADCGAAVPVTDPRLDRAHDADWRKS